MTVDSLEEGAESPKTHQGAKDGAYAGQAKGGRGSIVGSADPWLGSGHILADGADEVYLGAFVHLLFKLLKWKKGKIKGFVYSFVHFCICM